jgi:hypothetical protein
MNDSAKPSMPHFVAWYIEFPRKSDLLAVGGDLADAPVLCDGAAEDLAYGRRVGDVEDGGAVAIDVPLDELGVLLRLANRSGDAVSPLKQLFGHAQAEAAAHVGDEPSSL